MTITPLVFVQENSTAGADDTTGMMVKTIQLLNYY